MFFKPGRTRTNSMHLWARKMQNLPVFYPRAQCIAHTRGIAEAPARSCTAARSWAERQLFSFLSTRSPSTVKKVNRERLLFRQRFRWFPLASGGLDGTGGWGEPRFRRAVYIPVSTRCVFGRVGLDPSIPEMRSGFLYWCYCGFGDRR